MTRASPLTVVRDRLRPAAVTEERKTMVTARNGFHDYRWGSYPGPVTFFRATYRVPVFMHLLYVWRRYAPQLTVVGVRGAHRDVLSSEHARGLGARLSAAIEAGVQAGPEPAARRSGLWRRTGRPSADDARPL